MENLQNKRTAINRQLSTFQNYIDKITASLSDENGSITEQDVTEIKRRLMKFEPLLDNFNDIQFKIDILSSTDNTQIELREAFENAYYKLIVTAEKIIADHTLPTVLPAVIGNDNETDIDDAGSVSSMRSGNGVPKFVKLPTISLPKFEGNTESWLEFRDTFMSLIHENDAITHIQKYHYLRGSLQGKAAELIKALEFSSQNYEVAWENLCARYNNTRVLVHNHIKSLFNIENTPTESSEKIRNIIDCTSKHLRAIKSLTPEETLWETMVIHLITSKLDPVTSREWEQLKHDNELPSLADLKAFLSRKADLLETLESRKAPVDSKGRKTEQAKSSRSLVANTPSCPVCNKPHFIQQCGDFLKLSVENRQNKAKELKLCLNCLRKGHFVAFCKSSRCRTCKRKHHTLLHEETSSEAASQSPESKVDVTPTTVTTFSSNIGNVLLSTAIVKIKDYKGNFHRIRALLDPGSQSSFMTKALCTRLNIKTSDIQVSILGIGQASSKVHSSCKVEIQSCYKPFKVSLSCLILNNVTGTIPNFTVDVASLNMPKNLQLADPEFYRSDEVDMLIGADCFWSVLAQGRIVLGRNNPVMQNTHFGWIVSGPLSTQPDNTVRCHVSQSLDAELLEQLARFWEIEHGPCTKPLSVEERYCETHFSSHTKRDQNGRFVVSIPMKESPTKLGDSRQLAINRFLSLEKRLCFNSILRELYTAFMAEYEVLGHMSSASEPSSDEVVYYLPHHGVLKEDSLTTKLRVVFDASMKTSSGYSLNDLQLVGPTIQQDLFSILLRFRKHTYAISADIEKMYRQVLINDSQRSLQRIFWRPTHNSALQEYVLNTVTYGTASAPYLAIRSLAELGNECANSLSVISNIIKNDFYVDDLLTGADTIEEAQVICKSLNEVLRKGCFNLRKWISNDINVLTPVSKSDIHPKVLVFGPHEYTKTLGLIWSFQGDHMMYAISKSSNQQVTKRSILSEVSQVFDPLGLLSPCTITAKMLLQDIWRANLSWDEPIPTTLLEKWRSFKDDLINLNDVKIPRHVICKNPRRLELHGFSDASVQGYGACLYLRSTNDTGSHFVHLLCSKTRVAPLKTLSVPRLELCAAVVLARLASQAYKALNITFNDLIFWTDSTVVLGWIGTTPNLLKPFVANRVAEIQELSQTATWRHVPTKDNPADLPSRGVSPSQLKECSLWWNGPSWLSEDNMSWPILCTYTGELPERKVEKRSMVVHQPSLFFFNHYSSLSRLQRIVAYCIRFKYNCLTPPDQRRIGVLTPQELQQSLRRLISLAQHECFDVEIQTLKAKKPIKSSSSIANLHPFIDIDGLIRVGGRLQNSNLPYGRTHPILLPKRHKLTKLLLEREHLRLLHCGPQLLLNAVREQYWPLSGRCLARQVVHQCVKCFRSAPKCVPPIMGNLPASRVTPSSPFNIVGVDYAGPIFVKDRKGRGCKTTKAYISLFVCFTTKALHLELVSDLTAASFLLCLRRFVSRRGKPLHIYSDNGKNFIGAKSELDELGRFLTANESVIQEQVAHEGMTWHFIPPYSPHFGGLWEAGVKSVKLLLKRVIANTILTFEEMYSLLVQIEAILNSRPLTPLTADPQDMIPICPAHFLIGKSLVALPDPDVQHIPEPRLSVFQRIQQIQQQFWKRWSHEYLSELQRRSKWCQSQLNLKPGIMVLLKDDNLPPLKWKIGRIHETIPGKDGVVRVVVIRTPDGLVRRAVTKVCPLPIDDNSPPSVPAV